MEPSWRCEDQDRVHNVCGTGGRRYGSGGDKKSGFRDCLDGTSNTIALVEVKPEFAVPWTAPDDYAFAKDRPAAGLLLGSDGRWLWAFADGSVQVLRGDIKPETVLHLFLRADGEVIDRDEIR